MQSNEGEALPRHPMAVVVARTGLTADAIRVWERRYGVVRPARGPGGHRLYSDVDVERLRLLRDATEAGRRIGDVAGLSMAELSGLVGEDREAHATATSAGVRVPREAGSAELVRDALELTRGMRSAELESLLRRAMAGLGVRRFTGEVVGPLLHEVGEEWAAGTITIAQEHMASALVQDLLGEVMRATGRGGRRGTVLVGTPAGERHGVGALLAGVAAAAAGWAVVDLGVDLPSREIADAAIATGADVIALSVVHAGNEATVRALREVRRDTPAAATVIVGGFAAGAIRESLEAAGIRVAPDVASFEAELPSLARA